MSRPRKRPVVDFDHYSPEHASDPAGSFKRLNEKCPVVYSERHGGFWIATGHREVTRIARDPVTFSTRPRPSLSGVSIPPFDNPVDSVPLEMDPPEFVPYRRLLLPLLSPRATEAMRPMIQYYADYLLDGVIEGGEMELIGEFANPAPSMVTLDWLGLPVGDWRRYADPFKFNNHASLAERARGKDGLKWVYEAVHQAIVDRRKHPRNDLLSYLANAHVDGALAPEHRAEGMAFMLIAGGVDTTTILTAHALVYLEQHRDSYPALLRDDRFLRTATEEFLRWSTPVLAIGRTVATDVEVAKQRLQKGDRLLNSYAAANRDEAVFSRPNEVVLDRWPNPHTAFGIGPHRCLGSNLARAMFGIMLRSFLRRMPDYQIVEAVPAPARGMNNGWSHIQVRFTAGERILAKEPIESQFEFAPTHSYDHRGDGDD